MRRIKQPKHKKIYHDFKIGDFVKLISMPEWKDTSPRAIASIFQIGKVYKIIGFSTQNQVSLEGAVFNGKQYHVHPNRIEKIPDVLTTLNSTDMQMASDLINI